MKTDNRECARGDGPSLMESPRPDDVLPKESFGYQLRLLRRGRGLSIRRLAKLARIDAAYLSRIERGRLPPPRQPAIARLAIALQIEEHELTTLASRLPEDLSLTLRRRPQLMMRLIRAGDRFSDDQLGRICHALETIDPSS